MIACYTKNFIGGQKSFIRTFCQFVIVWELSLYLCDKWLHTLWAKYYQRLRKQTYLLVPLFLLIQCMSKRCDDIELPFTIVCKNKSHICTSFAETLESGLNILVNIVKVRTKNSDFLLLNYIWLVFQTTQSQCYSHFCVFFVVDFFEILLINKCTYIGVYVTRILLKKYYQTGCVIQHIYAVMDESDTHWDYIKK